MERPSLKAEAIAAWSDWGERRPRSWLARYGGIGFEIEATMQERGAYRQAFLLASQAVTPPVKTTMTTDPRFDAA